MNLKSKKLIAYYGVIFMMLCTVFLVLFKETTLADELLRTTYGGGGPLSTYYEKVWENEGGDTSNRPEEINLTVTIEKEEEKTQTVDEDEDEEEDITSTRSSARSKSKRSKTRKKVEKVTDERHVTITKTDRWAYRDNYFPAGYKIVDITEEEIPGYKFRYENKGSSTFNPTADIYIVLYNTWTTGDLIIKKEVQSEDEADKEREFKFIVTLNYDKVNGKYGDLTFTDGVAEVSLKDGETAKAEGLPINVEYTVTEEEAEGFNIRKDNDTGTITEGKPAEVFFTNIKEPDKPKPSEKTGGLKVTKTVTGSGNKNKAFNFTVELSDKTVNGAFGNMNFKDGTAEFTLKHGENKSASGLPAGIDYTVTESGNSGYIVSKSGDTGTIPEGGTASAEFTNHKSSGGGGGGDGNGGGGGGGGHNVTTVTPDPKPETPEDKPVTPGNVPPTPWYKLPVMGDEQFGPGFVNDSQNKVTLPETQGETGNIIPQLAELYAENSELAGWITLPGTEFGYPVMLSPNDPYYYQHHTFDKKQDEVGIPFMGPYCNKDSMNVLIHGHNMRDVSQFGYIWNYRYPEFLKNNPTIDFKTLTDENGSYDVMAVFFAPEYAEGTENVFWWYRYTGDMNKEQFDYYVQNVKALSLYDTGVTAEYGDKLITLETCASSKDSTRLVVVARKSNEQK